MMLGVDNLQRLAQLPVFFLMQHTKKENVPNDHAQNIPNSIKYTKWP
jgi:hypothetical protein